MPDKRNHRGPHPEDARLFTTETLHNLHKAVTDMSWLLSNGYADKSSLKLVGDRYELVSRQRLAVMRCACSDQQQQYRQAHQVSSEAIRDQSIVLDGYNVLITIEAALARGVLFIAHDGCIRDLASIHGTYRKVQETIPAIELIAYFLNKLAPSEVLWLLDKPVSNSGRLKKQMNNYAEENRLNWQVDLAINPDKALAESEHVIITSDSVILDKCIQWFNLQRFMVQAIACEYDLQIMDLSTNET